MIAVVNYGLGNIGSIINMFKFLGIKAYIANRPEDLVNATKLILPGVGAFDTGMNNLYSMGWIDTLNEVVLIKKIPILGICLGMQLMTKRSEEGNLSGLNWIDGETLKFSNIGSDIKIPHMGWNEVDITKTSALFNINNDEKSRFYFVHSYFVKLNNCIDELTSTFYGDKFTSSFQKENIFGVQFHPEKSHKFGMELFKNFATI